MSKKKAEREATAMAPGTINAARQDTQSIIKPTNTGASALPTLPKTPLIPSVMPCFLA